MFAAVLDTCVLWPSLQRDFLLSMAVENLYRPLWSSAILAELEEHEARKLRDTGVETTPAARRAGALVRAMNAAFDDALVAGWEPLEGTFGLPDIDDEHVLAAARVGGAGAIVTDDVRDFPNRCVPSDIRVLPDKDFAADTVAVSPERARLALETMIGRYTAPAATLTEVLRVLETRYGMVEAVDILRNT